MTEMYHVIGVYLDELTQKQIGVRVLSCDADSEELYGDRLSSFEFDIGLQELPKYKGAFDNAEVTEYGVQSKSGVELPTRFQSVQTIETEEDFEADLELLCSDLKFFGNKCETE